jgi:hypothetical protein
VCPSISTITETAKVQIIIVVTNSTSLTPPLFIEVPVPSQESEQSCIEVPVPSKESEQSCIEVPVPIPHLRSEDTKWDQFETKFVNSNVCDQLAPSQSVLQTQY